MTIFIYMYVFIYVYLLYTLYIHIYVCIHIVNPIKTCLCSPINLPLLPFSGEVPKIEQSTELDVVAASIVWPGCNVLGGQVGCLNPWHNCLLEAVPMGASLLPA